MNKKKTVLINDYSFYIILKVIVCFLDQYGVIGTYLPPGPCTMGLLTCQGRPGFFVESLFMPMGTVCFAAVD